MSFQLFESRLVVEAAEAAKAMKLDDSHQALHASVQQALATKHRTDNPDSGYYDYPSVHHTFGDQEKGTVVYRSGSKHMAAPYSKKPGADTHTVGEGKPVSVAYVAKNSTAECSITLDNDNKVDLIEISSEGGYKRWAPLDSAVSADEVVFLQEAAFNKDGLGVVKLIGPGTGSSGEWTTEALKKAVKDKVFPKGTQNFIDHATAEERKRSGTGSVSKLASVLEADAYWKDEGSDGPGIYAPVKAYPEFKDFLNARAKDIGMSVHVGVIHSDKKVNGVPVVEALVPTTNTTVDYVSRAGAGGKLVQVWESFRANPGTGQTRPPAARSNEVEIDEKMYNQLKAQADLVPSLTLRLDRLEESNQRNTARALIQESIGASGLRPRSQERVAQMVLAELPLTADKSLDVVKLQESCKKHLDDEIKYMTESGAPPAPVVRRMGGVAPGVMASEADVKAQEKELEDAGKLTQMSIESLAGIKKGVVNG